jgi:hypothetical protein
VDLLEEGESYRNPIGLTGRLKRVLCRVHPNIPIHTIGLGNYFDQNASTFLISIAKTTKGTFRGQ